MVHSLCRPGIRLSLALIGVFGLILLLSTFFRQSMAWGMTPEQVSSKRVVEAPKIPLQLPGDCGPLTYPKLVFEDRVESGVLGWIHNGPQDQWEISTWRYFSENHAWHAEAVAIVSDQSLISTPIDLPDNEPPLTLRFWNYQDFENSLGGCYDGALLEISTDDGLV